MSGDGWESMSHAEIVAKLSALQPDGAFNAAQKWSDIYTKVSDAAEHYRSADTKISQIWTGEGPDAARMTFRDKYTELQSDEGIPAKAGKLQNALFQDGACLTNAGYVPQAYPVPPDSTDKDAKQKLLEAVRAEAQRLYTEPLDVTRPEVDPTQQGSQTSPLPQNQPGSGGGGGGGQGAGSGSGAGGSSPFGSGSGTGTGGSGLPLGSTTAAGYGPSGSAGGTGLASGTAGGASALRAGGGLPGGATSGAGANPAAIGAAGVRGGAMGPMGIMGGAGAHGKGGPGEDDDEHETPAILINLDNTYEFMGDLPKASPAVIGDWSEQEKADKQAQEREKRRYKKLGWDVEFE